MRRHRPFPLAACLPTDFACFRANQPRSLVVMELKTICTVVHRLVTAGVLRASSALLVP